VSNKVVEIVQDGSYRAAQPPQVLIVGGNSIEFTAQPGGGTLLVLTPETRSILSPTPASTVVEIAGGASVSFEFLSPSGVDYRCQVLPEGAEPQPIKSSSSQDVAVLTILSSEERGGDSRTGRGL
jgi:hypothetical protein